MQLELREDGTFSIYQPDTNRVLSVELARQVAWQILSATTPDDVTDVIEDVKAEAQSTVGGGVIATSDGPVDDSVLAKEKRGGFAQIDNPEFAKLTDTEVEADRNAAEARASIERGVKDVEQGNVKPAPVKRRPGRPRKQS